MYTRYWHRLSSWIHTGFFPTYISWLLYCITLPTCYWQRFTNPLPTTLYQPVTNDALPTFLLTMLYQPGPANELFMNVHVFVTDISVLILQHGLPESLWTRLYRKPAMETTDRNETLKVPTLSNLQNQSVRERQTDRTYNSLVHACWGLNIASIIQNWLATVETLHVSMQMFSPYMQGNSNSKPMPAPWLTFLWWFW